MVSEAARSNLQAQVKRLGRTTGELKIGVDTRKPREAFSVKDSAWRDWSVVFRSYAALVHPALKWRGCRLQKPMRDFSKVDSAGEYLLLLHSTSGPALDRVVNAGSAEGLRAWQLLVERYDSHTGREQQGNS